MTILTTLLQLIGLSVGPLLVAAFLLTAVNRNTKKQLSLNQQLYLGSIGIIIHEASHAIMAFIFRFHITQIKLIKRPHPEMGDNSLGFVSYNSPQNLRGKIGTAMAGIAPIIGCSAVIIGLFALLLPQSFNLLSTMLLNKTFNTQSFFNLFTSLFQNWALNFIVWLLITTSITVGGFDLSSADRQGFGLGFSLLAFLAIIIYYLFALFNQQTLLMTLLTNLALRTSLITILMLFLLLITNLVVKLFNH
ncbi:hypothetical protein ACVPPR_01235 [Dellaglioa sp. L3N]